MERDTSHPRPVRLLPFAAATWPREPAGVTISEATWAVMHGFVRNECAVGANSSNKGE
jgi:hypothetical protein